MNIYRYSDAGGIKDQFTDWAKDDKVKGKGEFNLMVKVKKDLIK